MHTPMSRSKAGGAIAVAVLALATASLADFQVSRSSLDGGAASLTGGGFEVSGTIGQPDAQVLTAVDFEVTGGFWFAEPVGDCDATGLVDLFDYTEFSGCFTGPDPAPGEFDCPCFDLDLDGDVDLADFNLLQTEF